MSSIKKVRGNSGTSKPRGTNPSASGRSVSVVTPTTRSDRGLGSNPAQKNDFGARYDQMLQNNAGSNEFLSLLSSLGIEQEKGLTGSQRDDWNKQLLDTQLNYQLELEKRGYNEQMRDEQRIYDSPTNMLARLMGAGISRDAAIQMLSGAGGSSPIQSEGAAPVTGLSASESKRNDIESKLGIANSVFGGLSAIGSMVSLGFSIPQAINQTHLLRTQNYMSNMQRDSYDAANMAFEVLSTIGASSDAFGSVQGALTAINEAAKNGNVAAQDFINNGWSNKLLKNGSMVAPLMAKMYKDNRDAKDYNERFYNEQKNLVLQNEVLDQQVKLLSEETLNTHKEFEKLELDIKFTEAQIARENATIDYLKKQGRVADANAYAQELENRKTDDLYNRTFTDADGVDHNYLWYLNGSTLYSAALNEYIGRVQNNPELREFVADKIACDARLSYFAAALQELDLQQGLQFEIDNSNLASLYHGLEHIGYYKYIESRAKGVYQTEVENTYVTPLGNAGDKITDTYIPVTPNVKTTYWSEPPSHLKRHGFNKTNKK